MEFRVMGWRVYSQQWTNYIFLPASALVMVTLFPALGGKRSYTLNWEYPTAAVGMLVGSVLIMIQMNPVPFVALYLEMLFKTFQRIMIAVLIFSPLFLGFFFSFRILITKEDIGWFQLMTMIVGDSNYEDMMDEGRGYFYEVVAYFFFAAFIFLVIIVVLNLLIGLAVSDVQKLKAYAHVTHLGNQVRSFYVADAFYGMGRRSFVTTKRWTYELRHSNSESTKGLSNALKMELLQLARKRGCSDLGRMEFNKSTHRAVNTVIIPQYRWNGPMAPGPLNRINHNYY
ncbi:unnamed protein product [Allacma fusca]|uniref:Ion transport domain-containing protein n=1 Tax=Allacma fusca TaxID=39272 RepID=A0A8J2P147_9HEXA|nr:unnamed protein product [Allacma fusca]